MWKAFSRGGSPRVDMCLNRKQVPWLSDGSNFHTVVGGITTAGTGVKWRNMLLLVPSWVNMRLNIKRIHVSVQRLLPFIMCWYNTIV